METKFDQSLPPVVGARETGTCFTCELRDQRTLEILRDADTIEQPGFVCSYYGEYITHRCLHCEHKIQADWYVAYKLKKINKSK